MTRFLKKLWLIYRHGFQKTKQIESLDVFVDSVIFNTGTYFMYSSTKRGRVSTKVSLQRIHDFVIDSLKDKYSKIGAGDYFHKYCLEGVSSRLKAMELISDVFVRQEGTRLTSYGCVGHTPLKHIIYVLGTGENDDVDDYELSVDDIILRDIIFEFATRQEYDVAKCAIYGKADVAVIYLVDYSTCN